LYPSDTCIPKFTNPSLGCVQTSLFRKNSGSKRTSQGRPLCTRTKERPKVAAISPYDYSVLCADRPVAKTADSLKLLPLRVTINKPLPIREYPTIKSVGIALPILSLLTLHWSCAHYRTHGRKKMRPMYFLRASHSRRTGGPLPQKDRRCAVYRACNSRRV
jgi:hypothetical protein